MVQRRTKMKASDIQERLESWTSLVWEDGSIARGVACFAKESDREFDLRMFVEPDSRGSGIGEALYEAAMTGISAFGRGRLTVGYRVDGETAPLFFRKRGLKSAPTGMKILRSSGE